MEPGELMLAWQGGDTDAGESLTVALFPRLYKFFHRFHPDEAEDLTQETFYRMLKAFNFVPGQHKDCDGAFYAWVFTIARRLSRDRLERNRTAREKGAHLLPQQEPTWHAGPEDLVIDDEERRTIGTVVDECLTDLSTVHREVLALEMEGLAGRHIAEVLGVKRGTVGSRLNRAHERFQQALARRGYYVVTPGACIPRTATVVGTFADGLLIHLPAEEGR